MYIPIGLLGRSLQEAHDQQVAYAMESAGHAHEVEKHNARAMELWQACTGPDACLVVLGGNDWSAASMDHIHIPSGPSLGFQPGGYRDPSDRLGPGPHGLLAVCPGRHVVLSHVAGHPVGTAFTLHPREAYFLRLDRDAGVWGRYDPAEGKAILDRAARSELTLFDYNLYVAGPRVQRFVTKSRSEALQECATLMKAALTAIMTGDQARAVDGTHRAGASIVGVPLLTFEPITTFVGFNVFELVGKNEHEKAWSLLQAGLTVLPDNPTLLGVLGELQLRQGAREEGRSNLERALGREAGLDPALKTRVRDLLDA